MPPWPGAGAASINAAISRHTLIIKGKLRADVILVLSEAVAWEARNMIPVHYYRLAGRVLVTVVPEGRCLRL